jgi:hypothetical protein
MEKENARNYKCKDEELPVVCRNASSCLRRDFADFAAFSPVFNEDYLNKFDEKINLVDELVSPKTETDELKKITKRLYQTMDSLIEPIANIRGYLRLAKDSIETPAKDFGLTLLSKKIAARDAEGVRQNLLLAVSFLNKYREPLMTVGLNSAIIEQFNAAISSITADNKLQFEIVNKRKAIVQKNLKTLNELYKQLTDLLSIGKSLYKMTDPAKAKEYVFQSLKKGVRNS